MFHHILISYDGSANSKKALEYGIDFAMHAGATLTVVTVFEKVPDYLPAPQRQEVVAWMNTEARRTAEMGAEQARACNIEKVNVNVLEGMPAECILSAAELNGCDCIVVGARGKGEMAEVLLGSVSDRLVRHARIPVLVVK